MKQLSYWALLNPKKTIAILTVAHLLIAILTFYLGVLLFAEGVLLSKWLIYISIFFFILVQIFYPIRRARHKFWKANYTRQKVMDFIIVAAYIVGAAAYTNIEANVAWKTMDRSSGFAKQIVFNPVAEDAKDASKNTVWKNNKQKRKLKKQFKKFIKKVRQEARSNDNTKGKVAGVIIGMIVLLLVVTVLSCVLACNDIGVLALLLFLGGWVLVLVFGIKLIRKLRGKKPNNYQPSSG